MQFIPKIDYPENEKPTLVLLENLFRQWHQHFASNSTTLEEYVSDDMVFDGFYPHYFNQEKRFLFIGWEPVDIAGFHYVDVFYGCYRSKSKRIGDRHLN